MCVHPASITERKKTVVFVILNRRIVTTFVSRANTKENLFVFNFVSSSGFNDSGTGASG